MEWKMTGKEHLLWAGWLKIILCCKIKICHKKSCSSQERIYVVPVLSNHMRLGLESSGCATLFNVQETILKEIQMCLLKKKQNPELLIIFRFSLWYVSVMNRHQTSKKNCLKVNKIKIKSCPKAPH